MADPWKTTVGTCKVQYCTVSCSENTLETLLQNSFLTSKQWGNYPGESILFPNRNHCNDFDGALSLSIFETLLFDVNWKSRNQGKSQLVTCLDTCDWDTGEAFKSLECISTSTKMHFCLHFWNFGRKGAVISWCSRRRKFVGHYF